MLLIMLADCKCHNIAYAIYIYIYTYIHIQCTLCKDVFAVLSNK